MKGYRDSTKTQWITGSSPGPKGAAKVRKVMREFKDGDLHSGSKDGPLVANRKQAVAIALSEARKRPMKKAEGGAVNAVHKHERHLHPGEPLTKLAKGGRAMVRDRGPLIKSGC